MFDVPVAAKRIVLAPAERADVLIDFSKFAGETLVMKNHKPQKPVSNPAPSLKQVMQILVGRSAQEIGHGNGLLSPRPCPTLLPPAQ
jgi:hypothetical protein